MLEYFRPHHISSCDCRCCHICSTHSDEYTTSLMGIPLHILHQLAPIVGLYFPHSFIHVGKYLYFIGSASSFYFVYDFCLYEGMSSEVAYLLRFLPLLLAILTCTLILLYRSTFLRLKRRGLTNHGVWWVILLMYTHVVYSALMVLNCPTIRDTHGTTSTHWFVNGAVSCFTGSHIALALLSALVLLVAGALIPVSVLISTGKVQKFPKSVRSFYQPLTVAYRVSCRWWSAVELSRRLLFLLVVVELPNNKGIPVLLLALCTTIYMYVQPYKSKLANMIEAAVNLNFLLLLILNATTFFRDDYLTFPPPVESDNATSCSDSVSGIATVSWILMPFYYLPLVALCTALTAMLVIFVRKKTRGSGSTTLEDESDGELLISGESSGGSSVEYSKWSVELTDNGFLHLATQSPDDTLSKSPINDN